MTVKASFKQKNSYFSTLLSLFCLSLAAIMIFLGEKIKEGIISGLSFSFMTLIPTLFPFFILSDLWTSCFTVKENGFFGRLFEWLFGVNGCAITAFLSGLVCGFPIGVKAASELYHANKISKDEFEHLCGFVNNPSVAFIISGVGVGIFGNISLGIMLYISVVLSSIAVGILFRSRKTVHANSTHILRQSFDLVNSIKAAGLTSIAVASYIIFFSGIIGMCSSFVHNEAILGLISSILEVGSATKLIGSAAGLSPFLRLIFSAFALGFSGLSVHLQALSFFPVNASKGKYFIMKLLQGMISALFMAVQALIFP